MCRTASRICYFIGQKGVVGTIIHKLVPYTHKNFFRMISKRLRNGGGSELSRHTLFLFLNLHHEVCEWNTV